MAGAVPVAVAAAASVTAAAAKAALTAVTPMMIQMIYHSLLNSSAWMKMPGLVSIVHTNIILAAATASRALSPGTGANP